MATKQLTFRPGVNTQATLLTNQGGFSRSNMVRFKDNFAERWGGWQKLFQAACAGLVRAMHAYEDLNLANTLLIGTDGGAQIFVDDTLYNFTLARKTSTLTAPWWTATSGSSIITVTDTAHGAVAGDTINNVVTTAANAAGSNTLIWWAGIYHVLAVIDANTYTVDVGTLAGADTTGGYVPRFFPNFPGQVSPGEVGAFVANSNILVGQTFTVDVPTQVADQILSGPYTVTRYSGTVMVLSTPYTYTGSGTWYENGNNLTGYGQIIYFKGAPATPQNWFMDNLGQNGLISLSGQGIYIYSPPVPANGVPVATLIITAPQINTGFFVAMPQAQILAFGSEAVIGGGTQDPLLVRWSDAGSYSVWVATVTNQAGSFRLSRGSRIIGGIQAPQTSILWTDVDAWSVSYIGPPLIYSFIVLGSGCGLIAPKARGVVGRTTYWMGTRSFWQFGDQGVQPLECDVYDVIFGDLDRNNEDKCFMATTSSLHEWCLYYPSASGGTGEIDSYVQYNVLTGKWTYGKLEVTAWLDANVFGPPLGTDANFHVQRHEETYDADGAAINGAYVHTGWYMLSEGDDIPFLDRLWPDLKWFGLNGYITVTVYGCNSLGETPVIDGPYTVTPKMAEVPCVMRKRFVSFRFEWAAVKGFNARLGTPIARIAPSGKAP